MTVSTLRDVAVLLGVALAFVLLFRRLGLGATLAFLVAGALVGPQGLGWVGDVEEKRGVAELGITLLLFVVGLELNPGRLWRLRQEIFALGALQVAACALALTGVVWAIAGFSPTAALAVALPLALSSTAQVLPMLQSAGRLRTPFGERAFSILLFQDLSIVPLITIIAALSRAPAPAGAAPGWLLAVYTVLAVAGLVLAGRFLLRPLFRLIGNLGERELFVFAALFTVIASATVMQSLGLSTALGAFVAGVMLADSPYRHELEADVDPFRSILLGLFFLSVGMMLDLGAIAARPVFVVTMAVLLIVTKALIIAGIGLIFRMQWRSALKLGLLLSQGGEFGFVLFNQAQHALLIAPEAASLFGAIVTLSMATTPFLMAFTARVLAPPVAKVEGLDAPVADGASALVIGYGRFGQTVAQMLIGQRIATTVIDSKPEQIQVAADFGMKVYFGDGTRLDLLRQAGAADVQLIAYCIDGDVLNRELIDAVHHAFPQAAIFARAYDRRSVMRLDGAPLTGTVREVFESAVVMARAALDTLGVDSEQVQRTEDEYRRRDALRLKAQAASGDIRADMENIFTHKTLADAIDAGQGEG
ncbi:cation:proton antiporter [Sphingomonas sp.]|uniref:cation:proton antiporter domain-containing protein n=1 Tax=Sphingomonas sp. TaxID=28214 RepID=UPI001D3CF7BD|nr:cation:proton antiporter [Sphingomonas sp.]MBX9796451.1 cation:proton antiporter [Sphingomonas sp.]